MDGAGEDEHYSTLVSLHEGNWKADVHQLPSIKVVEELTGYFNSQAAEQLNKEMWKCNYSLNMMTPTASERCYFLDFEGDMSRLEYGVLGIINYKWSNGFLVSILHLKKIFQVRKMRIKIRQK